MQITVINILAQLLSKLASTRFTAQLKLLTEERRNDLVLYSEAERHLY